MNISVAQTVSTFDLPKHKAKVKLPAKATSLECGLVMMWFLATATTFNGLELLRYSVIASLLALSIYHRVFLLKFAHKLWFLALFPIWVLFTVMWSLGDNALRFAIMHLLDVFVIAYIALRLSPKQIILSLFLAYLPIGLFVFSQILNITPSTVPEGFSEKNHLSSRMFFFLCTCLYYTFEKRVFFGLRIILALFAGLSLFVIYLAESATAFVLSIVAIIALVGVATLWKTASKIQSGRVILGISFSIFLLLATFLFLSLSSNVGPLELLLDALGKDSTFTGRTEIWNASRQLIEKHPVFGLGAEGYWQTGRGHAEELLSEFGKEEKDRFSFHNSYLEIWVHLGIIGLFAFLLPLAIIVYRVILYWIKYQDLTATFFVVMCILPLARSLTESDLYNVFEMTKVILFLSGLIGLSYRTAYIRQKP